MAGLWRALSASRGVAKGTVLGQLFVTLVPALFIAACLGVTYRVATAPEVEASTAGLVEAGEGVAASELEREAASGLIGAPGAEENEPGVGEPPAEGANEALPAEAKDGAQEPPGAEPALETKPADTTGAEPERLPIPLWLWVVFGIGIGAVAVIYRLWNWERLEVFKMLLSSFFPLALLILMVLGSIVFGLATPSEAAAVGGFGGFVLIICFGFFRFGYCDASISSSCPVSWFNL